MRVEEIPPASWGAELASEWDRLLEESSDGTIFQSHPWVTAWWTHFGTGCRARLLAFRDGGGGLCGLAPLYDRPLRILGLPGPTMLRFLGDEGVGSEYLGILVRRSEQEAVLPALGESIKDTWSLADLRGLREDSPVARALPEALMAGVRCRADGERHPCSMIPLPSDYESYLASLPTKFRTTVRYRTNKLMKNFAVKFFRTTEEGEIDRHLDHLFQMHQGRWEAEGHPGSFSGLGKRSFYADVSREFLRRGWLRFYHLEVDGAIRASQFGFLFRGVLHSLQEAFDHEFHPPGVGGVGVVLRGMVLRDCIAEGIHGYDFLGGEEEFKTRWGTRTHHVRSLRIAAPSVSGAAAFALTAGVRRIKVWMKARSPEWILKQREEIRAWRRLRRARQAAHKAAGARG